MFEDRRLLSIAVCVAILHLCAIAWMEWGKTPMRYTPSQEKLIVKTVQLKPEIKKPQPKPAPKKSTTSTEKKSVKKTTASTTKKPAKKPAAAKKKEPVKNTVQNNLIAQARERLSQVKKTSQTLDDVSLVDAMQIDSLEGGVEDHGYYTLIATTLRKNLRLPEYGEVKVHLCLDCQGTVVQVNIISAQNENNSRYVEKVLPSVQFPPFGKAFQNEKEHTFTITLANDL